MPWELPRDVDTPALVVDLDVLGANVAAMATDLAARGLVLRPHAKTHKSVEIARRQRDAGAVGLTVATLGEAEVFAAAGFDTLFVAYPLVASGPKAPRLRALADRARLRVGVDSVDAAGFLGSATAGGPGIEVLVELDSGQHRTGVAPAGAPRVAEACRAAGLEVVGVFTHPGHAYERPGSSARAADDEARVLAEGRAALQAAGFAVTVRSGGSTPTARHARRLPAPPGADATGTDEQRPGSYVFNDRSQVALGSCRPQDVALVVAATVVSAAPARFVVDAGSKALSPERIGFLPGFGGLAGRPGDAGRPADGYRDGDAAGDDDDRPTIGRLFEHHGVVEARGAIPKVGDVVAVVPNHVCPVVDHFDRYVVTRRGRVVDHWPIDARGRLA
jgi:D-serine deaminase-like pyridoxal phosphate-dependent protein